MSQNEIRIIQLETEGMENNQQCFKSKLAKLQNDTNELNKQLTEFSISDTKDQNVSERLKLLDEKYEKMRLVQELHQDNFKTVFTEITEIQKKLTDNRSDEIESQLTQKLADLHEEFETKWNKQEDEIRALKKLVETCSESKQKLSEELKGIEIGIGSANEKFELIEIKKKQETQEIINQEVIKEIRAMKREIYAFGKKEDIESNKNIIPIEREITGIWKPSSITDYKHYVKPDDPVIRSHWLSGQLLYSLKGNEFTYKLIVVNDEMKDVMKESTVTLGKRMKYKDHTETWTFENNHLVIVFRNKTDESIIKKYFQFFLDGMLHIVYHDLENDVTSTRIYQRVI